MSYVILHKIHLKAIHQLSKAMQRSKASHHMQLFKWGVFDSRDQREAIIGAHGTHPPKETMQPMKGQHSNTHVKWPTNSMVRVDYENFSWVYKIPKFTLFYG